jgi:hypothetical protein
MTIRVSVTFDLNQYFLAVSFPNSSMIKTEDSELVSGGSPKKNAERTQTTTILRIKRKRTDDPVDALLVAKSDDGKKLKQLNDAKVFRFVESVSHSTDFSDAGTNESVQRVAIKARESNQDTANILTSLEKKKQVLAAGKLRQAKQARYKVVSSNRKHSDGIEVFDISRDEEFGEEMDSVTRDLMPMVKEYLNISVKEPKEEEYVFDLYYYEPASTIQSALEAANVGTL